MKPDLVITLTLNQERKWLPKVDLSHLSTKEKVLVEILLKENAMIFLKLIVVLKIWKITN